MTADLNSRIWFSTAQAAEYAGCDIQTVSKACRAGTLKAGQPFGGAGGRWRINRADLDAWLRGEKADVQIQTITRPRSA